MSCIVDGIVILMVTLGVFIVCAWGVAIFSTAHTFGHRTWEGIGEAWRVIRYVLPIPALMWIWRIRYHGLLLVGQRWVVEQIDPYAHQPYKPREPETRGRSFWDDYYDWHEEEVDDGPLPSSLVPPVLVEERGVMRDIGQPPIPDTNGDWKLITFLRAVMGQVRAFSRRGAMRDALYSRAEWEDLEDWAVDAGFHKRGTGVLTAKGKRWATGTIRRLVMDNHHSPTPADECPSRPVPVPAEGGD
jgi:hypothetical protein